MRAHGLIHKTKEYLTMDTSNHFYLKDGYQNLQLAITKIEINGLELTLMLLLTSKA